MAEKIINETQTKISFKNIKSRFCLKKIFENLNKFKFLKIIQYNKNIQNKFYITLQDYKDYTEIEIEIISDSCSFGKLFNANDQSSFYKIQNNSDKNDNIRKINIKIDGQVKSFKGLFKGCSTIKKISFIKFNRRNILDMSEMFSLCSSLEEIDFSIFNTNKVTNMSEMFNKCISLKYLNLLNFDNNKVTDMSKMFIFCSSLEEIDFSNFKTTNIKNMSFMFSSCKSLKNIDLSNFDTNNVTSMDSMFYNCTSLKYVNFSNNIQVLNISLISVTLLVLKLERFNSFNIEH